jgi:protein-S-isoprenylcysteine O-methyltransferase Ste14
MTCARASSADNKTQVETKVYATRVISWLPLLSVVCFLAAVVGRTMMLGRRGIRARVSNSRLPLWAKVIQAVAGAVFWIWVWMVNEFTFPPPPAWLPHWLTMQVIDLPLAKWLGAICVIIPAVVYPITLAQMGNSWRMGIDRDAHDPAADHSRRPPSELITHGLYRFVRHPIYLVVDLLFIGTFLVHGAMFFLVAAIAFSALIHVQLLQEEAFLAERYGEQYKNYCRRVRRYGVL